jgi:hypothetical protein
VAAVQTYALPSNPQWRGVCENNGGDRAVYIDLVEINYSADPILTID